MTRAESPLLDKLSINKWRPPTDLLREFDESLRNMIAPEQPGRAGLAQKIQFPAPQVTDYGFRPRKPFG